jgi:hypothetical protein
MNRKQKICLWAGIALIVVMGLFPPWVLEREKKTKNYLGESMAHEYRYTTEAGPYSWIGSPPWDYTSRAKFVDLYRLGIQYFVVAIVTAGLIITLRDKKGGAYVPTKEDLDDAILAGRFHLEALGRGIAKGAVDFAKWSAKVVEDMGEWVKPHLPKVWDEVNKHFETEKKPQEEKPFDCGLDGEQDPEAWKDLLYVGGYHLKKGLREFKVWSAKMIEDLGDAIKPHLQGIWDEVNKNFKEETKPQEVKPFDCGLDTETYDDKLVAAINKIGADFQARIEKLEKARLSI